jgi:hypothetical protein
MGGSQSIESVVYEEPYPGTVGASGLSLSQAEKCNACRLGVNTKITTSNVKLKREQGAISIADCKRYAEDVARVNAKTLSVSDFLARLQAGRYSELTSNNTVSGEQYCQELSITDTDAAPMRESGLADASKFKRGRIRKVANASFSEETKAKFIPSIPFEMSFTAKKAAMGVGGRPEYRDVNDSFTVSQMTLYHPAPIRIDSIQADAILSLNDPSDTAAKYIVLIPLRAVNSGNPSNEFLSRIVRHLYNIKEPRPDTGEYAETTIPTGADWSLNNLFTLTGNEGSSLVKNGFFTWTGVGGYERVNKGTRVEGFRFITTVGWKPTEGLSAPQYILLDTPLDMNTEDMTTLTQSLPVTPPSDAIHSIPPQTNLVYYKAAESPAPDTMTGKQSCGIGNVCEGFATGEMDPSFVRNCPGAKCDPFLQNASRSQGGEYLNTQRMVGFLFNFFLFIAMLVGGYIALSMIRDDYDLTIRNFSEQLGQVVAVWTSGLAQKMKSATSFLGNIRSTLENPQGKLKELGESLKEEGGLKGLGESLKEKGGLEGLAESFKEEGGLKGLTESSEQIESNVSPPAAEDKTPA